MYKFLLSDVVTGESKKEKSAVPAFTFINNGNNNKAHQVKAEVSYEENKPKTRSRSHLHAYNTEIPGLLSGVNEASVCVPKHRQGTNTSFDDRSDAINVKKVKKNVSNDKSNKRLQTRVIQDNTHGNYSVTSNTHVISLSEDDSIPKQLQTKVIQDKTHGTNSDTSNTHVISLSEDDSIPKRLQTKVIQDDTHGANSDTSNTHVIRLSEDDSIPHKKEGGFSCNTLPESANIMSHKGKTSVINSKQALRPLKVSENKRVTSQKLKEKNLNCSEITVSRKSASKGEYHCNECDITFKYASALNKHKKDGVCLFICPYCGKRYTARYYSNYQLHLKYHNKEKPYLCATCGKAFTEKSKLTVHLMSHNNERPCICEICGRGFYTRVNLRYHIQRMHKERPPKPYECDICDTKFVSIYNLNTHKKVTHSDERPFQCGICLKTFKTKAALEKKHIAFHHKTGPMFHCTICPKSFRLKDYLKIHMKRHNNERTHFCNTCGKGFYDKKSLREHVRIHSGEKPYECNYCDYRCALKGNLGKHMKTHSDDKVIELEKPNNNPEPNLSFPLPFSGIPGARNTDLPTQYDESKTNTVAFLF